MSLGDDCEIRFTRLTDGPYLRKWLLSPGQLKYFPMSKEKDVDLAMRSWLGFSKFYCGLTATEDKVPIAMGTIFLMPYKKVAHHCVFKLIVDPEKRRQGVGTAMLRNLMHLAKTHFRLEFMQIEIFEGNPLEHILQAQSFYEVVRQEKFVKEGDTYLARQLYEVAL